MTTTILPTGRTQTNLETIRRLVAETPTPEKGTSSIGIPIDRDGLVVPDQRMDLAGYVEALKFPDGQVTAGYVYCSNPQFANDIETTLDEISPVITRASAA